MQVQKARFSTPRTVATDAAKTKQFELWQLEKCDVRIKPWKARECQLGVRVGAKRECLSKWVAQLKHDRIDDDAENERDEEVWCDCFFPQRKASSGSSPLRKRTEKHTVVAELDAIRMLCAVDSFKAARRRAVQTSSRIICDRCGRSVFAVQGCFVPDSGKSPFKQEQFIFAGCLMAGIERGESHECNKLGRRFRSL